MILMLMTKTICMPLYKGRPTYSYPHIFGLLNDWSIYGVINGSTLRLNMCAKNVLGRVVFHTKIYIIQLMHSRDS